jgi:hypothetical protein
VLRPQDVQRRGGDERARERGRGGSGAGPEEGGLLVDKGPQHGVLDAGEPRRRRRRRRPTRAPALLQERVD